MRRRDLILTLGSGMIARSIAARAQQKATPIIGYLSGTSPGAAASFVAAFRQGLSQTDWIDGQNVSIEYRWAEDHYERLPALAADLVDRKVDVIAIGGSPGILEAKRATSAIPIVFAAGVDPLAMGLVASLARPGGNLTGIVLQNVELMAKRLELLSELVPRVGVIALLVNPNFPQTERIIRDVEEAARAKKIRLAILKSRTESEIDAAFGALVQLQAGALIVAADPAFFNQRDQLLTLASRYVVPAIYAWRELPEAGGLISYGTSLAGAWRQLGLYAGKILNGAKPADLPVEQPTKFELVVNLKTAKALGLTVPPLLLATADEVIE